MSMTDKVRILQLPGGLGGALLAWIGQQVTVYLTHVSATVPMPTPGAQPCPPYQQPPPPTAAPSAGGPSITGGTPIIPGVPGPTGNVGPITGSPIGSTLLWGCPPEPGCKGMETAAVTGTLAFVGVDYLIIRVPVAGRCLDLLIPYNAIGTVEMGCMV